MTKQNNHQSDREMFGRCEICMEIIPIEYYFSEDDVIVCDECGTEYSLLSKNPVKMVRLESDSDADDYLGEMKFE